MRIAIYRLIWFSVLTLTITLDCFAQESTATETITLNVAVEQALINYPSIRVAQAQVASAEANIDVARTVYLPRLDLLWQQNRATSNNVAGLLFPQATIPAISGPIFERSYGGAWGSAGGALLSWEPFDFGQRAAQVDVARAAKNQASAGATLTQLDVATLAADAFLTTLAAQQTVRVAQANVDRLQVFTDSVRVLVNNQLRAGVELSRAEAELAAARNQLIQAQQTAEISRVALAEAIGRAGEQLAVDPGPLLELPNEFATAPLSVESHPLARAQAAAVDVVRARERVLDRSYFPRFNLQSAFFGRGTGFLPNGQVEESRGLYPRTANWAAGISISFPTFEIFGIRARRKAEESNESVEKARYEQTIQNLKTQSARAQAVINAAQRIAANTPLQLKAAQESEKLSRLRYENGLTTVTEVAEAQRLLAQAETDDAVARLGVWRALLAAYRAQGDIKPFIQKVLDAQAQRRK